MLRSITAIVTVLPLLQPLSLPLRPNPSLTPGSVATVDTAAICQPGYAHAARHVTSAEKRLILEEYQVPPQPPRSIEIDHLVPLELGGSNDARNLWPESYVTQPWNAHVKDRLENWLHAAVCGGWLPLARAQHDIATDWIGAYQHYIGPLSSPTE